ncbi:MAG: MFS transporter [Myxococcota bacterium]
MADLDSSTPQDPPHTPNPPGPSGQADSEKQRAVPSPLDSFEGEVGPLSPFRVPQFCWVFVTGMLAASANWMLSLSVPFLVYEMTNSEALLGVAAVASNAPALIASPLGGVWADRYSRKGVLRMALLAQCVIGAALFWMSRAGTLDLYPLLALSTAMGFASSVNLSAYQPIVSEIVPERLIAPAYRLNAIQFNLSRAIGPAVAGFVLAGWGATAAFFINAVSYLPLIAVLSFVVTRSQPARPPTSVLSDLLEGARVSWDQPALRLALIAVTFTALFGMSVQPLMAGLAKDVFHVAEAGLGTLVASIGVSAAITSIVTAGMGDRIRRSVLIRLGLFLYGVGFLVVASSDDFNRAILGFVIVGFAHVLVNVSVTTAIQLVVTEELRGRVTSLQLMGIIVSMPIGAQIGGLIGEWTGLSFVVALFGGALIGFAGIAHWRLGGLRDLD